MNEDIVKHEPKPLIETSLFAQRKTIATLVEESRADEDFFVFLTFAAFVTTLGILLDNSVVIISGMLIAPLLSPILALGMSVVTSSTDAVKRSLRIIGKSIILVVCISAITTFFIGSGNISHQLLLASNPDVIYFLIAFFSGSIAAYAWTRQNVSATLPSVAVSVSLLVPLCALGISITYLLPAIFSSAGLLFLLNLLAVTVASILMFSLFGFARLNDWQEQKIKEEERTEKRAEEKSVEYSANSVEEEYSAKEILDEDNK